MEWHLKQFGQLSTVTLWKILYLRDRVFVVEQKSPYQEVDKQDLHSYHLFATNDKDKIMAYARFFKKDDQYSFGRVVIPKSLRGQGLGKQLVNHILVAMKKIYGDVQIIIEAQYYAKDFYRKCGFHTVGKAYRDAGRKHITMIKDRKA